MRLGLGIRVGFGDRKYFLLLVVKKTKTSQKQYSKLKIDKKLLFVKFLCAVLSN